MADESSTRVNTDIPNLTALVERLVEAMASVVSVRLRILEELLAERGSEVVQDNAAEALLGFVKADDRAGFDALASCLMPADDAAACWRGTRARLGLAP